MTFKCLLGSHEWQDHTSDNFCGRRCRHCGKEKFGHDWQGEGVSGSGTQNVTWWSHTCNRCGAQDTYDSEDGSVKIDSYTPGPNAPRAPRY